MSIWSGIPEILPTPCDICKSDLQVESRQVKKVIYGMTGPVDDGYRQSNLCENCKSQGWTIGDTAPWGYLEYWNFKTAGHKRL